jgi:hypothetical protein
MDEDSPEHLARFFAVLRLDGLYLYSHPRKRTAERVLLLDSGARVSRAEVQHKAGLVLRDVNRVLAVPTREQGRCALLAGTEVDADWCVATLKAHGRGPAVAGALPSRALPSRALPSQAAGAASRASARALLLLGIMGAAARASISLACPDAAVVRHLSPGPPAGP